MCAVPFCSVLQLLVKVIRLIANMSISAEVGERLTARQGVGGLTHLLRHALHSDREELLLNTVSALTNLSFYGQPDGESG